MYGSDVKSAKTIRSVSFKYCVYRKWILSLIKLEILEPSCFYDDKENVDVCLYPWKEFKLERRTIPTDEPDKIILQNIRMVMSNTDVKSQVLDLFKSSQDILRRRSQMNSQRVTRYCCTTCFDFERFRVIEEKIKCWSCSGWASPAE